MIPLIQPILQGSAPVRALLGDPIRVWPGVAPQGATLPYATWGVVGGSPVPEFDTPPADGWRVRITVWGQDTMQANAAAVAIRDEVERRGSIESYNPSPDPEGTDTFGISFDVRLLAVR